MDDVDVTPRLTANRVVNLGLATPDSVSVTEQNFISAMTAAVVETFSFVFVAFTDANRDNFIMGVSACLLIKLCYTRLFNTLFNFGIFVQFNIESSTETLAESSGFGRRAVMDGPVRQLQLNVDAGLMYAITDTFVS